MLTYLFLRPFQYRTEHTARLISVGRCELKLNQNINGQELDILQDFVFQSEMKQEHNL